VQIVEGGVKPFTPEHAGTVTVVDTPETVQPIEDMPVMQATPAPQPVVPVYPRKQGRH
jgi:hypothetical protein